MLDTSNDIVDVGKIPIHVAVVVNLDGFPLADFIGKFKIGHIGPAKRTIDRKETQSCCRNPIKMTIGIGHKFVGFFRCRIQTDRMIHIICRRKRRLLLIAINRRTGSKEQMVHLMMAASFEDIEKANDIRINIGTRMVDAVTHSGLSCQIYNNIRLTRFEYAINSFFIRQITFDKGKPWKLMENIQPAFLQRNIIIIVKVIQTKDGGHKFVAHQAA